MQRENGLTLIELLITLAISTTLLLNVLPAWDRLTTYNRLVADTNRTIGLIRLARSQAVGQGAVLICASGTDCSRFTEGQGLMAVLDLNDNGRRDAGEPIMAEFQLQPGTRLYWRSFRNRPHLRLDPRGTVYYQNGHFMLCQRDQGRKVVVSWLGSLRSEKQSAAEVAALC